MTFGKVMGGGFPAAAFGGPAELMQHLAPVGGVYQAGTLSGNPVATAAGLATLRLATPEVYAHIDASAARLQTEVAAALGRGKCAARHPARRELVQRLLRQRGRDRRARLRRRGASAHRPRIPRSSTRCSTPVSICRPAPSRVGFSRRRMMMEPWTGLSTHSRRRRHGGRSGVGVARGGRSGSRGRSCTWSATVRSRIPPACCTAGCPTITSPSSAARWPVGLPRIFAAATSCTCGALRWSVRRKPWSPSPTRSDCRSPRTVG